MNVLYRAGRRSRQPLHVAGGCGEILPALPTEWGGEAPQPPHAADHASDEQPVEQYQL